jgi:Fic family protein
MSGGEESLAEGSVSIALSRAQIDRVMRAASSRRSMSALLSRPSEIRKTIEEARRHLEDRRLSSSLLYGLLLLAAFPADGSYVGNAEVARMLGIGTSTAHRYISTLVEVGLIERNARTRRYRLAHVG